MDSNADPMIRLDHVSKRYRDGTVAVDELSLEVPPGEVVVLVGPSGCGKTTTMKMVNRLVEPTDGRIYVGGEDVSAVDPVRLRRGVGYVIQHVGLFPHRTILENTMTVPRLLGWSRGKARDRAAELLDLVGLEPGTFADRYPAQLSGGQRQRVGVARALAADPPVLLMDEPFGAVDPIVRDHLQAEFLRLQWELRKTVLFVTHDIDEAVRVGDRIAVFTQGGSLEQFDSSTTVLGNPATGFVADFVGADRGLKRLAVTPVDVAALEHPAVVRLDAPCAEAARVMGQADSRWAVVLDDEDNLHGWVDVRSCEGTCVVAEHARRMEAWVPTGAPLKIAFAEMLQHNAGWIAVLDGDRYLGVLTPRALHEALRRSVEAETEGIEPAEVELDTVANA